MLICFNYFTELSFHELSWKYSKCGINLIDLQTYLEFLDSQRTADSQKIELALKNMLCVSSSSKIRLDLGLFNIFLKPFYLKWSNKFIRLKLTNKILWFWKSSPKQAMITGKNRILGMKCLFIIIITKQIFGKNHTQYFFCTFHFSIKL